MEDYYEILGVDENASISEIKKAYYELVKKYHPDNVGSNQYDDLLKKITVSYECLSNPEKRRQYDLDRKNYKNTKSENADFRYEDSQEKYAENESFQDISEKNKEYKNSVFKEISWGNFIWFVFSLVIIDFLGWNGIIVTIYSIGCIIGICGFLFIRIRKLLKHKIARIMALLLVLFIGYYYWKKTPSVEFQNNNLVTKEEKSESNIGKDKESSIEKQAIELAKAHFLEPYDICSVYEVMEYSWKGGSWSVDNDSKKKHIQYYLDRDNYINFYLNEDVFVVDTYVLDGRKIIGEEKDVALNELFAEYSINFQSAHELDYMEYVGKNIEILLDESPNLFVENKNEIFDEYFVHDASCNTLVKINSNGGIEAIGIGDLSAVIDGSYNYELVKNYLPSYAGVRVGMNYTDINSLQKFNDNYYYTSEAVQSDGLKYMYYTRTNSDDIVSLLLNEAGIIVAILWSNAVG